MLLLEVDPVTAGHVYTGMAAYRAQQLSHGVRLGAEFDGLMSAFGRVARARPPDPLTTATGLLPVAEAAPLLRMSPRALQRRLADGDLAGVRDGARWLVDAAEVRRYATEGRRQASQPGQEAVEDASSGETKEEAA
jgi:excisionase family DNA binding protein